MKMLITFDCENCRVENIRAEVGVDGYVECASCGHTVYADVYLGDGGYERLARGEEVFS